MPQTFYPPVVGQWYRAASGKGQLFEVIAMDVRDFHIEIQYFDGSLDLLELETWLDMDVEQETAPENWLGAFDVPDLDDLGSHITDTSIDDWLMPFSELSLDEDKIIIIEQEANQVAWQEEH